MSWLGQVRHVMTKDIRQSGWVIALTVGVVGVVTVQAMAWSAPPWTTERGPAEVVGQLFTSLPLVPVVAVLLAALVVQADSPSRSDAFWVTRPLTPSAVLAAKLSLLALVVLALPLAGQLAALAVRGVPVARLPALLGESALEQAGLVTVGVAIAALTPDLRTFLVALVLAFLGWSLGAGVLQLAAGPLPHRAAGWLSTSLLWTVGGLALVAYQYRTRDVGRTLRVFALPLVGVLALSSAPLARPAEPLEEPPVAERLRASEIRVEVLESPRRQTGLASEDRWWVRLGIELVDAPERHRYALLEPTVTVRLPGGSEFPQRSTGAWVMLSAGRGDFGGAVRLGEDGRAPWSGGQLQVDLPERAARALVEGRASLELEGTVEVREARPFARIALRSGARVLQDGWRFQLIDIAPGPDGPSARVVFESVMSGRSGGEWHGANQVFDVAFVNDHRREALPLTFTGGSSNVGPILVLPGPRARIIGAELEPRLRVPTADSPVPEGWWENAELAVERWVPVGTYPIHESVDDIYVRLRR